MAGGAGAAGARSWRVEGRGDALDGAFYELIIKWLGWRWLALWRVCFCAWDGGAGLGILLMGVYVVRGFVFCHDVEGLDSTPILPDGAARPLPFTPATAHLHHLPMTTTTATAAAPDTGSSTRSSLGAPRRLWRRVFGWWPLILLLLAVYLNPTPLGVGVWNHTDGGRSVSITYGYRGDDVIYVVAESAAGALHSAIQTKGGSRRLCLSPDGPETCLAKSGGLYICEDSGPIEVHPLHLSLNALLAKLQTNATWQEILLFLRKSTQ